MKTLYQILDQFRTDLAADIPALISAASLTDFDNFIIGQSRDEKQKVICIYKDELRQDDTNISLSLIFQVQLPAIDFETATKYEDVLLSYLNEYSPSEIGLDIFDGIASDTWPMERTQGVFIYIMLSFSGQLDSCD